MTKATRSIRSFQEIADLFAEQTAQPTDSFSAAFTQTVDGFRISREEDETDADMPDPMAMQLATEMLVRTMFDVMQGTRLETIAPRIAWGVVHSLYKVTQQLDGEADRAAQEVRKRIRDADGSEIMMGSWKRRRRSANPSTRRATWWPACATMPLPAIMPRRGDPGLHREDRWSPPSGPHR